VSALRRTGPRKSQTPSVDPTRIPRPVQRDPTEGVEVDPDHGLWEFFHSKDEPFPRTDRMNKHGRAWAISELRNKHFDDLHSLWWVCVKEKNRIATAEMERQRVGAGYGQYESDERNREVCNDACSIVMGTMS